MIEGEIRKANAEKSAIPENILAFDDFVKKSQELAERLAKEKDMARLDWIIKKIFSNFTVKNEKVINLELNSPFKELADIKKSLPEGRFSFGERSAKGMEHYHFRYQQLESVYRFFA